MFGMGMGEIILIAVVALLVLGPERLPGAAKAIGKGIRDLRAQTKDLQSTIEHDTEIGDAVREIRGALRGDPETLYKRATGEDFLPKEEPKAESEEANKDSDEEPQEDELHAMLDAPAVPIAPMAPKAPAAPEPPAPVPAANLSTDSNDAKAKKVDPDIPVIRTPASAMARGDGSPDTDSSSESDNDSGHG